MLQPGDNLVPTELPLAQQLRHQKEQRAEQDATCGKDEIGLQIGHRT
jgi:hypothetical protein